MILPVVLRSRGVSDPHSSKKSLLGTGWCFQCREVWGLRVQSSGVGGNFARWVGDRETVQVILALVEELKQRARALAKPNEEKIRVRALEIWEENDRPVGRDVEFWLQAEREFREAEDLAKES
jgi:hypothetical protein